MVKYSDLVADWLLELGYSRCFFVAGGNIMHLLDAVRTRMECIPFVHEVAAGIAAETHNEALPANSRNRAFSLVTAGPGLTNIVTAFGGAWLESRELLVLGGQAKSTDLASDGIRQRGIQEIDGVSIVRSLCVVAKRIETPMSKADFTAAVERGRNGRKGPVFLEFCLDAQGAPVDQAVMERPRIAPTADDAFAEYRTRAKQAAPDVARRIRESQRPVVLIGGGVTRETANAVRAKLEDSSIAVMTTWNGLDRYDARAENFFGRPNQWGQRHANILIQQADLVVALGTRLGMQQTGFNWQEFSPGAVVVQAEIDETELAKGHPRVDMPLAADANTLLVELLREPLGEHELWLAFAREVRELVPLEDPQNVCRPGFIDPYKFWIELSDLCAPGDLVIPCSSGGAETTFMQAFKQKSGQISVNDKGLASMGYGLSAAIGAALSDRTKRTVSVEGDGGFTQNLQELATVAVNHLNLKFFIFSNEGYASIRMTQRNYFGGEYLGCDVKSGLGFPDWVKLMDAYGLPVLTLDGSAGFATPGFAEAFESVGPQVFIVPLDPEQTYYPKINSRVTASGSMQSAPLHLMSPELPENIAAKVLRFVTEAAVNA
jgi:acetolactate synthase-1/2/3 large subunit